MDEDDVFAEAIASRYRIERTLGEGGMAIIYLARDCRHDRLVALKVLRPEVATTLGAERFLREITIAARLVHPNILPLHDSGAAAGRLYYVMPYVEGATLRQRMDREKQLPLADVADITTQIATALDYAHGQGVVHRDVKPDNVLLMDDRVLVADFGLARALTSASSTPLTRTGMVVGTPAYMSPEQCAPGEAVDGRSDVYALACMTFEMIAGVTPFRGATAQAMMVRQLSGDPPSVCAERDRCPRAVDDVLKRGLAKSPADRYQRAGEFAAALTAAVNDRQGAVSSTSHSGQASQQRRRRWMPFGVLALAVVLGGWFAARNAGAGPALDRNVYAVFPLRETATPRPGEIDGAQVADLLSQAMARWSGVRFVNNMRVSDVWARRRPLTVEDGLRAAERLSAGTLAWGEIVPLGDSLEIRVVAYDVVGGPDASREFTKFLPRHADDFAQLDSAFNSLADSILVGGRAPAGMSVTGTHSLSAFNEFRYGHDALRRFDLRSAQDHFDAAARADEDFGLAHLWAARLRAWRGEAQPKSWLRDAMLATRLSASLSNNEKVHAYALLDLAEGRAADACQLYRRLLKADETDFAAWLGLGDCNALDDAVVTNGRSPTGYAFRGSYWSAFTAYQRALALVPAFHQAERGSVFQRLARRVLITEESTLRRGVGVPPDTQRYVAFQSFPAETLAYFPVPYQVATHRDITPPTEHRAVAWAARTLRDLMREWRDAYPTSPDAQAAYSLALETAGAVDGTTADLPQALALARSAAARTDSADLRFYREIAVVRLLIKLDSLGVARRLSDSLLAANSSPTPYQAGYLANLAALTGQARRAAALLRVAAADSNHVPFLGPDGRRLVLPGDLMPNILALRAYASLGEPRDSVRATYRRVERMLAVAVPAPTILAMRNKVLSTPAVLSDEHLGASELANVPNADPLLEMRAALERRDAPGARAAGSRFSVRAQSFAPGTMGIDRSMAYATMLLALGDTAEATQQLDGALENVSRARSILLEATPQAGAVGRARLVRVQIAVRAGDQSTARRRLAELAELWSGADAELRAELEALRRQL